MVVLFDVEYTEPVGVYVAVQQYEPGAVGDCADETAVKAPPLGVVMATVPAAAQFNDVDALVLGPHI